MRTAVIVDAIRTPFGRRNGSLSGLHPADLLGVVVAELLSRSRIEPEQVDDVIGGCVTQCGEQGLNVTRNAWIAASLPWTVAAVTVDRQCGSSLQAVQFAASEIMAGFCNIVIACGVESMSRVPLAANWEGGLGPFSPSYLKAIDNRLWFQFRVANELARGAGVSREDMDEFAVESHRRAATAGSAGLLAKEIVSVPSTEWSAAVHDDEGIRPGVSVKALAQLPPAQQWESETAPDITAGNSSQMSDGASAVLVCEESLAEQLNLTPLCRVAHAMAGADDAVLVLSAANRVTRLLFERHGYTTADFDVIECHEAFAAIPIIWAQEFKPDPARLNAYGGAIALGHPLGASGGRLVGTACHQLERSVGERALVVMCEGGGQANAMILERL